MDGYSAWLFLRESQEEITTGGRSQARRYRTAQVYLEHVAQYPPISNRDTTNRNRQSFSTCPFNFSKMSLTNSMIVPQRILTVQISAHCAGLGVDVI